MSSKEIFSLRKQGRTAEALELARTELPHNNGDLWFLRAYAWALYDHVKKLVDQHELKQLSQFALSNQLSPYMREFARIGDSLRGDSTFSQMLRLAGKVSKDWPDFLGFARWAGVVDFSVDDKASFTNDQGKSVDSLQKRFTRAICRETVNRATDAHSDRALIDWGMSILEQALRNEPNDQWLNYYQSKWHLAHGERDQAIRSLIPVLRRQSRSAWPWALLGEILEATEPEDALTCYTYSAQLAREEQEVANVRIHLARLLALACRFNEAAQQASLALQFREQHKFKVPPDLQQLLASDWYHNALANNSMQALPKAESIARALLQELDQQSLTFIRGVIDHINVERGLSYVATGADTGLGLSHRRFSTISELLPGTVIEIGQAEPDGPPEAWRLSNVQELPGLFELRSGSLKRQEGRDFAFIRTSRDDIFVPPDLAQKFVPGDEHEVTCMAIRRKNRQGKTGWRTVMFIGDSANDERYIPQANDRQAM